MARVIDTIFLASIFTVAMTVNSGFASVTLDESKIDRYWREAKYHVSRSSTLYNKSFAVDDSTKSEATTQEAEVRPKSPGKAFALSMLVPGLGQYYNGSKIKAVTFLNIEAISWFLQFKWHSDGKRLTGDFETFQETHWSEPRYSEYLLNVYGYLDDDSVVATEVSHHLPDTRTQQYYEMTGKYDQFVWGWDDATLNGHGYDFYHDPANGFDTAIAPNVPVSVNRLTYEKMRYDANKKFSNARKMIMVALGNRLVSALEAFISAKRSQSKKPSSGEAGGKREFSHWKFQGKLRSVYARYDTPYLKVTYGF